MPVTPPIDPSELVLFESLGISVSPLFLRILGIALLLLNSFLFSKLFEKRTIPFVIFLINPWSVFLHTFFTVQCLLISIALVLIKKDKKILFLILSLIAFIFLQKTLPKDFLFLSKITPSNLAFEINERQKIDFLATGKTYILPPIARKITYNKPSLAVDKVIRQFVSFFDFEQMTAPLESYEIIKLSGISPKGSFPMFFIWEIPLIIYGIFINRKFLPFLLISLIPIFAAEKKLFTQVAFLSLPIFLYWEGLALQKIYKLLKPKVFLIAGIILLTLFVIPYYKTFYTKPLTYKTSENFFYQRISEWVGNNRDKNVIVTTMFGPTEKMTKYYLGSVPQNISFQSFDLNSEGIIGNTYYIGLPGQFVRHGKNLKPEDSRIPIVEMIKGEDELVFEYGENIWIGYQK